MQRRHFDQLATPESWQSPVSVVAHIDLDAFYAQCLTVHHKLDPAEPLGCRQWGSLIAVNYPAREFGIKRGMSVDEARKLCPQLHVPHVATFKKGDVEWKFHSLPNPYEYKVSLDPFRRESRRIFAVFKRHFQAVEKAGIDEGFIDLGPEIHKQFKVPDDGSKTIDVTYEQLLEAGARLVDDVRAEIYKELHYTCSAGIAPNKLLAKLGSQYKKPNHQTIVFPSEIPKFLANFKITDAWGWGGKNGSEVLQLLGIENSEQDQCEFVRNNYSLETLEAKLGDPSRARRVYSLVRGQEKSEIKPRTLPKSLVAVKNFTTGVPIQTVEDLDKWLRVFAADLAGRVGDIQDDLGGAIAPKTIGIKFHANKALHSRQQPFEGNGIDIKQFREQVYQQAKAVGQNFLPIPCRYLVVEIAGLAPLPKERLMFTKTTREKALRSPKKPAILDSSRQNSPRQDSPNKFDSKVELDDEPLFIDDTEERCARCGADLATQNRQEHEDWHFAKDLQKSELRSTQSPPPKSPEKRKAQAVKGKSKKREPNQQTINQFFLKK